MVMFIYLYALYLLIDIHVQTALLNWLVSGSVGSILFVNFTAEQSYMLESPGRRIK